MKIVALIVVAVFAALSATTVAGARTQADAAMKPATLTVKSTRFGRILFDGRNRVLYAFMRDRRGGPSTCYGECAEAWPVYFAKGTLEAGTGVKQSLLGKVRRRDGRFQVTYNGWPLYYYAHEGPGEVKCHNVNVNGGLWLVVKPSGQPLR